MELMRDQDQIRSVAARWKAQYYRAGKWGTTSTGDSRDVYEALRALPDTATRADVAAIIGNTSWIGETCNECGSDDAIVRVGEEPDYESRTAYLCRRCLQEICRAVEAAL